MSTPIHAGCSTSDDVVERIMSAHWDMAACTCWVCTFGRSIGLAPRDQWLNHKNHNGAKRPVPVSGWSKPHNKEHTERSGKHTTNLARKFHDAYERLAPQFGYETRPDTKAYNPDSPNGRLMAAVCEEVMSEFVEQLRAIAEMPEYDQDDAHRLRGMASQFLSQNKKDSEQ